MALVGHHTRVQVCRSSGRDQVAEDAMWCSEARTLL